jgi:phosphatidylinositol alpha-mannosyltransferase
MLAWTALNGSPSVNIATFHAFHSKARGYWIGKKVIIRASRKLTRKIAVSDPALTFVSRHLPADYMIIPNGVDTDRFCLDTPCRPELKDGKKNIVFVGRLEKRKGVPYLLEAFVKVKKLLPDTRLLIVGPGKVMRKQCDRIVAENRLDDVRFTGFVHGSELPGYYRSADVFCSPALYGESFGIVLLEAMASGAPVVASDITGYNSVVTHEKDGLLVPPADPDRLAEALVRILTEEGLRDRLTAAGVIKARDHSWRSIAGKVLDVYYECLKEAGR